MLKASVAPYRVAAARTPGPYLSGGTYPITNASPPAAVAVAAVDVLYGTLWIPEYTVRPSYFTFRVGTAGTGSSAKIGVWAASPTTYKATGTPLCSDNTGVATTSSNTYPVFTMTCPAFVAGKPYWIFAKHTGTLPGTLAFGSGITEFSYRMGIPLTATTATVIVGMSTPDAFANNIAATDLTSATFTNVAQSTGVPIFHFVMA